MASQNYIYTNDPGLIIGFHGCRKKLQEEVAGGKKSLRPSNNNWDWLGDGIYFWQNNYDRAHDYATNPPPGVKIDEPAVLGAVFSLGNCLDLTDKKYIDIAKYAFETLKQSTEIEGTKLPTNHNPPDSKNSRDKILRKLDCAVIKRIHFEMEKLGEPPFDSVRGVFLEGDELYAGAGFWEKTHIQVCIRNPNLIRGYFIPRKESPWP